MITYTIDGCNEMFLTLQEAKKHIWLAYTPKECIKELTDTCIVGWKDIEVYSLTAIRVNKNEKARKVCERWEKLYYNYDYTQRKRMVKRFAHELYKAVNNE